MNVKTRVQNNFYSKDPKVDAEQGRVDGLITACNALEREPTEEEWGYLLDRIIAGKSFYQFLLALEQRQKDLTYDAIVYYRRLFADIHIDH